MDRRRVVLTMAAAGAALGAGPALAAAFQSNRITVSVEGSGPDVILIPGLSSSPEVWASTVAALPGYRYHLIHLNGFAGAPAGGNADGPVSAPVAEEIARYIETAGLDRPAVIGHSMGGTIGMMLAARHPDRVGRLMVVDMTPRMADFMVGPGATPDKAAAAADAQRTRMLTAPLPDYRKAEAAMIGTMVLDPEGKAMALRHGEGSDRAVSANAMRELIATDLTPELSRISAPTTVLFVWGPHFPVTAEQLDAYYKMVFSPVARVTVKRIPDSAHFIMFDQPARFREEVKTFLAA